MSELEQYAKLFSETLIKLYIYLEDNKKQSLFDILQNINNEMQITTDEKYTIMQGTEVVAETLFSEFIEELRFRKNNSIKVTVRDAIKKYGQLMKKLSRYNNEGFMTKLLKKCLTYIPNTNECQCQGEADCPHCLLRRKIKKII